MKDFYSALREALRTIIIAGVPILTVQLINREFDLVGVAVAVAIGLLKGAEKWAHNDNPNNAISSALEFDNIK